MRTCLYLLLFLSQGPFSHASHIFGGELLYTCVNDHTYKLTLTFYGDCSAYSAIFHSLDDAQPLIYVYNNGAFADTLRLAPDSVEIDVSPVCAQDIDSTTCNAGTLPGVKKFVYTGIVTIPSPSPAWNFIFRGDMGSSNAAGRSYNITNIISPGTSLIQLGADLNNTTGNNSSPQYSTIPTPFYCVSVPEQYNQGAIDPDGDSLFFQLVPACNGQTGSSVDYSYPYNYTNPMSTSPGAFLFSAVNGELSFTPNITQDALVVTQVSEYRNGVKVGTSEREITFITTGNCTGTPPSLNIGSIYGGVPANNVINICAGTPRLSFILSLTNPEGDSTHLSYRNLPAGATLDTFDNGTPYPSASFSWNTGGLPSGIYTFYVTLKNNHCPVSNTSTIAYTIYVAAPPALADTLIAPAACIHQALMQYTMTGGFLPRTVFIISGTDTVRTYTDTTAVITDSLPPGNYTAVVTSDSLCTSSITFSVPDTGTIPLSPLSETLCRGASAAPLYIAPVAEGAIISWYTAGGAPLPAPPVPNTETPGTYSWYVTQQYSACSSLPDTVTVVVRPLPSPQIAPAPATICLGDTLYLSASGGYQYNWAPKINLYAQTGTNDLYIIAYFPQTVTLTATDAFGCTDTITISFDNVQQCCNFSYPNAFTPNNDGKNDGFHVLTYGHMEHYQLIICNRWGERVFYTEDPYEYWNGTHNGKPCDADTYYYYFRGQCLTGRYEDHKGNVTLVR